MMKVNPQSGAMGLPPAVSQGLLSVSNFNRLPEEALNDWGWVDLVDDLQPDFNPATEQVERDGFTIEDDHAIGHWKVVPRETVEMATLQAVIGKALTAAGQGDGEAWVQPTGYQNAYPKDWTVTHSGKTWRSLRDGASGEPGTSPGDWQEVVPEGEIPEWVQPMAGSEYPVGAQVKHNGHIWTNIHTGPNGWEPGTTGAQWRDDGLAEQ